MQAHKKCGENKRNKEKYDAARERFFMEGRRLYWCYAKLYIHVHVVMHLM